MPEKKRLGLPEFVALIAVLFATLAFSIDAMLPAFPEIAGELTPDAVNRAQLIILSFMLGMGLGTIFTGPLSDAYGRKIIITGGLALYIVGAALAFWAGSLELLLLARFVQGVGAAGPRIVPMAMLRDLYEGRRMAQIMSFVMTIFMLVPAVAPAIGQLIIDAAGWRYIFVAFVLFALIGLIWMNVRQPETLTPENRVPLNTGVMYRAFMEIVTNRTVMIFTIVLTLGFTQIVALITSTQQIYADVYGQGENFPFWFAMSALVGITGTMVNAAFVMQVGMRKLVLWSYGVQAILALTFLLSFSLQIIPVGLAFPVWFMWSATMFFMAGTTFGNLSSLGLQPLGHIAGMAASIMTAISTIASVFLAVPIGQAFNGTPLPLLLGVFICSAIAFFLMRLTTEDATNEDAANEGPATEN